MEQEQKESLLAHTRTGSRPSALRITDIRVTDVVDAPMHCILVKVYTNQGLVGLGEVRDGGSRSSILALKSRLLGENPCDIDRLFRRVKQFGGHGRQAGGVCGIELALWDLAGKAYGIPVYQMLGGKFRDRVRLYCDTDVEGPHTGRAMGQALKRRLDAGYTFLKMDLGISLLYDVPGALSGPLGFVEQLNRARGQNARDIALDRTPKGRARRNRMCEINGVAHPFTGIQVTEHGLDFLEQYVREVRDVIGTDAPLAIDHVGHIGLGGCIRLAERLEKFNIAWLEDMIPWQYTEQYARLAEATTIPVCTGEDIYLKESFRPLLESGVSVIHPDILTAGGILETKKIADLAQDHGVAMAIHMAESPVAFLAAVHCAAAAENFMALEFHSCDVPWWAEMAKTGGDPLMEAGFAPVPDRPGLGLEDLDDTVLAAHLHPDYQQLWAPTDQWDNDYAHDRLWS